MDPNIALGLLVIVLPFSAANYNPAGTQSSGQGGGYSNAVGVEEFINGHQPSSVIASGSVGVGPSEQAAFAQANAQLQALNSNANLNHLQTSSSIAGSLSESSFLSNLRQGNINAIASNVIGQTDIRSLLVPNGLKNTIITATQPLQPIIFTQPGSPPVQISSGSPAVVRAAPVVYKLKPSVVYQQEVINRVPTPLSLNPVYVKVYKPGQHIKAPPPYGASAGASATAVSGGTYGSQYPVAAPPSYGSPQYPAARPPSYRPQPAY